MNAVKEGGGVREGSLRTMALAKGTGVSGHLSRMERISDGGGKRV